MGLPTAWGNTSPTLGLTHEDSSLRPMRPLCFGATQKGMQEQRRGDEILFRATYPIWILECLPASCLATCCVLKG